VSPYTGFMPLLVQSQWSLCGSKRVASRMPTTGHVQKPCGRCMQGRCRLSPSSSLSSRPCNCVAASASGQARVGAREGGVWVHVERVHKCTGMKKKRKKKKKNERTHQFKPPQTPQPPQHVSCVCVNVFAATALVIQVCRCRLWVACVSKGDEQCRNRRARACQRQVVGKADVERTSE